MGFVGQFKSMRMPAKGFSEVRWRLYTRRAWFRGCLAWGCAAASAKDAVHKERLQLGGAEIDVSIHDVASFELPPDGMMKWVRQSGSAVASYFGRFPVHRGQIDVFPGRRERGVGGGKSFGDPPRCRISVGPRATAADLSEDWMLTHEMVHWGFPSVEEQHHWIEEGTATYVEPIARARIGELTATQVWNDMVRDMRQGLPQPGDQGLDNTHTWGRTYWGGALFCLLADVGIRERTENRLGFEDALRGINRKGGTIDAEWPLERALAIGDQATEGSTLADLYKQMSTQPYPVDLPALWARLGVRRTGETTIFLEDAPLAATRRAIMKGSPR